VIIPCVPKFADFVLVIGNTKDSRPEARYKSYRFEGSLEVKLPTIWTHGKAEVGRAREEKGRREKIRE
jgi:hypothetical protein